MDDLELIIVKGERMQTRLNMQIEENLNHYDNLRDRYNEMADDL